MSTRFFLMTTLLLMLVLSCTNSKEEVLEGNWAIEEFYFDRVDCRIYLLSNIFSLKSDHLCRFPVIRHGMSGYGEWSVDTSKIYIKMDHESPFNGEFQYEFERDTNKRLLYLVLKSEHVHIKAAKMLHNFDSY